MNNIWFKFNGRALCSPIIEREILMKKVIAIGVLFLTLFSVCTCSFATDALQPVSTAEKVQVKAKVVAAGESYVKEEAEGVKRTLQDVTLQIKERKI